MRAAAATVAVVGVAALTGSAWLGMGAARQDADHAALEGARHTARATAVAIGEATAHGGDVGTIVDLIESGGTIDLLVRDADGTVIAGSGAPGDASVTVRVPGTTLVVAASVPPGVRPGIRQAGGLMAAAWVVVLAASVLALVLVALERRRAAHALADSNRRFRDIVAADELTGLGNHARLVDDVTGLLSRGTRYGNGFALVTFDVDGAAAGEEEVRTVAHIVQGQARGADRCYRLGARVVSLLPEQGIGGAAIAAERIRAAVEESGVGTVSVGVGAYVPWEDHFPEDVIGRAGLMARQSAFDGGNCVTVAETSDHAEHADHEREDHQ